MKLLFCHYGPMLVDKEGNAYPETFTDEVLERYYNIADEIVFFTRTELIDSNKVKVPKVNIQKLRIASCPNISSIKGMLDGRRKANKILCEEIKKNDFLIVRLPSQIGTLAIDMAIKMKKPYLIELVGCPWDAFWNHSIKGKFLAPFIYYTTKKSVRDASHVVYVTNKFLQKRYPTNGESINCSNVSIEESDEKVLVNRLNKIKNIDRKNKIIIGTTAAVNVRYKGQQYVIEALRKLKQQGVTSFEYELVGGGNQTYLKSIAKKYDVTDQVKFLGSKPHDEVIKWLDTIDIYIQPSMTEGLPRALIEAMSRGLPSIGSDAGGIPELLNNLCIVDNISKNIDKISMILESINKGFMETQAKRNFEESKKYNREKIEKRRKDFFMDFKEYVKDNKDFKNIML